MPKAGRVAGCLSRIWPHTLGSVVVMRIVRDAERESSCEVSTAIIRKGSHRRILFWRLERQPVAIWFRTVAKIGTVRFVPGCSSRAKYLPACVRANKACPIRVSFPRNEHKAQDRFEVR